MHVCSYVCIKLEVCGSPTLSNWDRIFKQSRPDLDSITSGPIDGVDQGLHHCFTTCMLQIDLLVPADRGERMWIGGTRLWITRKEESTEKRSIWTMCCPLHGDFFTSLLSVLLDHLKYLFWCSYQKKKKMKLIKIVNSLLSQWKVNNLNKSFANQTLKMVKTVNVMQKLDWESEEVCEGGRECN